MAVVDELGEPVAPGRSGTLVARRPWPGMARTVWGNPERYRDLPDPFPAWRRAEAA